MSGGVSLAVWVSGLAREMNLLQEASKRYQSGNSLVSADTSGCGSADADSYGRHTGDVHLSAGRAAGWGNQCRQRSLRLLGLLNVTVTTDVLRRTSAGGINAALLGLSSAARVDLGGLLDLWLTPGSMGMPLRDPGEQNPPSLIRGDKVLFGQLELWTRGLIKARSGICSGRQVRPLLLALAKVFSQSATGQLRRLLVFLVLDDGETPHLTPQAVAADEWDHAPTTAGALQTDVGAQRLLALPARAEDQLQMTRTLFGVWRPLRRASTVPAGFPAASHWQLQTAFRKKTVLGDRWGNDQAS
jgi:hypothetical protein